MNTNEHESGMKRDIVHGELAYRIVGLAMEVHNSLGAGFLEKVYENALMVALRREGIAAKQQAPIKVYFEGVVVGDYVVDILVAESLVIELKVADAITNIHRAQALNYLKASRLRLALILNFAKPKLEYQRVVL
jgi:GxxExxY protein